MSLFSYMPKNLIKHQNHKILNYNIVQSDLSMILFIYKVLIYQYVAKQEQFLFK